MARSKRTPPPDLIWPTDKEEVAINAGIAADPDAHELTDDELASMRPVAEAFPDLVANPPRVRGPQKAPTKIQTTMRFDADVVDALKAGGRGWQTRANALLRQALGLSEKPAPHK